MIDQLKRLIVLTFLLSFYAMAYSQNRYVDISSRVVTPGHQQIINGDNFIDVEFYIINNGPDSVLVDDTLTYRLTCQFRSTDRRKLAIKEVLKPMDSILVQDTMLVTGNKSLERMTIGFFSVPVLYSYHPSRPLMPESQEDKKNNQSSVQVRFRLLAIDDHETTNEFSFYPNPNISKRLMIQSNSSEMIEIKVISLSGKTVFVRQFVKDGDTFNLQDLTSGMYTVLV
jgi:hypothetical protein